MYVSHVVRLGGVQDFIGDSGGQSMGENVMKGLIGGGMSWEVRGLDRLRLIDDGVGVGGWHGSAQSSLRGVASVDSVICKGVGVEPHAAFGRWSPG